MGRKTSFDDDKTVPEETVPEETPNVPSVTVEYKTARVGRNDPCPCGSGKKFKKCCIRTDRTN